MMKDLKGRVLIIPDVHQRSIFAEHALENEEYDHVVFLGDMFDCFGAGENGYLSFKGACIWVNNTFERLRGKATWLIGNHDCAYISGLQNKHKGPYGFFSQHWCSGVTKSKEGQFRRYIDHEWVKNLELCVKANGWYLSHAGFQYEHFKPFYSVEDNIERLYNQWEEEKSTFHLDPWHWIWDVGRCRGGPCKIGSPIWCDWDREFVDLEEIKQIVGHTTSWGKPRKLNRSWCLDCMQTWYAISTPESLVFKNIFDGEAIIHTLKQ